MKYRDLTWGKTEALLNKVGGEYGVDRLLAGDWKITIERHIINTAAEPYRDDEFFGIERHKVLRSNKGLFEWKVEHIKLWPLNLVKSKSGLVQVDSLSSMRTLNACVRDYLLEHPELIPKEWIGSVLCFSGTLFRDRRKLLYIPTLDYREGKWCDVYFPFDMKVTDNMVFMVYKG